MSKREKFIIAVFLVILAGASRLVKHPFNFTPIVAMSIFAGCYLRSYKTILIPIGAMLFSDYIIGFYDWQVMASVYVSIGASFMIGWLVSKHKKIQYIIGGSILSSIIFFLITNFAVWAFFDWYPHTFAGFINAFALAIPFFKNTFFGDLIYTVFFFGLYELVVMLANRKKVEAMA